MTNRRTWEWTPSVVAWMSCAAALTLLPVMAGSPLAPAMAATGVIVMVAAPFGVLWLGVRGGRATLLEMLGMGLVLSVAIKMLVIAVAGSLGIGPVPWWVFTLVGVVAVLVGVVRSRGNSGSVAWVPVMSRRAAWAAVAGFVPSGVLLMYALNNVKLPGETPLYQVHTDRYVLAAIGSGTARDGIHGSGLLDGVGVRYHWFSYAWVDWLGHQSGLSVFDIAVRLSPTVALLAMVCLVAGWLLRSSRSGPGMVLGTLAVVNATGLDFKWYEIFWLFPTSQLFGTLLVVALVLVSTRFIVHQRSPGLLLVLGVLSAAAMGTKVSWGAMACAGIGIVTVAQVRQGRARLIAAILASAVIGAASVIVFFLVASGQPDNGMLALFSQPIFASFTASAGYGLVVAASLAFGTQIARWLGVGYLLSRSDSRRHPITWWGIAGIVFVGASFITVGTTWNDVWFIQAGSLVATAAGAVGVAWGLRDIRGVHGPETARKAAVVAMAAGVVTALIALATSVSTIGVPRPYLIVLLPLIVATGLALVLSRRWRMAPWRRFWAGFAMVGLSAVIVMPFVVVLYRSAFVPIVPTDWNQATFTGADAILDHSGNDKDQFVANAEAAARWLALTANPDDLVATAEPTTTWLPALTGLRMFAINRELVAAWLPEGSLVEYDRRQVLVDEYVRTGAPEAAARLCSEGVTWLWFGTTTPPPSDPRTHNSGGITVTRLCGG